MGPSTHLAHQKLPHLQHLLRASWLKMLKCSKSLFEMDNVGKPGNNGVSFKIYLSVCFRKHSKAQSSSQCIYSHQRKRGWDRTGMWCVEASMWRVAEEKMVAIAEIVLKSR